MPGKIRILYIIRRELHYIFTVKRAIAFYCLVLPFIVFLFLLTMFSNGVVRKVPIAVVDNDKTPMSKEFARYLAANPYVDVKYKPATMDEAQKLFYGLDIFSIVFIDKDFQKNILRRSGATAASFSDYQYMMPGANAYKGIAAASETFAYKYKDKFRGKSFDANPAMTNPVSVSETVLFNSEMNYVYYMVLALIANSVQLFINMTVIHAFMIEIKYRRAKKIRRLIQKSPLTITGMKIFPYIAIYTAVITAMIAVLVIFFGLPLRGNPAIMLLGIISFVFMISSLGVLISAFAGNFGNAFSVSSIIYGTSFAFFGISIPTDSMPLPVRIWSELLPGTHFERTLINEVLRGVSSYSSLRDIVFMLAGSAILFAIGSIQYKRMVNSEHKWGA